MIYFVLTLYALNKKKWHKIYLICLQITKDRFCAKYLALTCSESKIKCNKKIFLSFFLIQSFFKWKKKLRADIKTGHSFEKIQYGYISNCWKMYGRNF